MTRTITSRASAPSGLPDVANDTAFSDDTIFSDGTVFSDNVGSVLAGRDLLELGPSRLSARGLRQARFALGE